jgi:dipeptidase
MKLKILFSLLMVGLFLCGIMGFSDDAQGYKPPALRGCTTILVGKNATADRSVIMGHNEDMGTLSGRLLFQRGKTHKEKQITVNYVTLPQVPETYSYWASGNSEAVAKKHYDGGWILCGMNRFGVSMGCNTMTTREERIPKGKGIMRYAIRRLILERCKTARDAVTLIGKLIDTYGQSDSAVAYCIADRDEAWLVETTYRHWVARRIPDDRFHVEANQYTIETQWDLASAGLIDYAVAQGWYKSSDRPFNFKNVYGQPSFMDHPRNTSRRFQGIYMLKPKVGSITVKDVLSVLSQPPVQTPGTQAFMVWHLRPDMPRDLGCVMWHGMCGANTSVAVPIYVGSTTVPVEYTDAPYQADSVSAWWQFERLQKCFYPRLWEYPDSYLDIRKQLNRFQERVFKESAVIEEEALKLWKQGDSEGTRDRLSRHTYKMLKDALIKAKQLSP